MVKRKSQIREMGMPIRTNRDGEINCRTDYEGSAKLQKSLANVSSQMGCFREQVYKNQQQSQLVSPFPQLFANQKVANGNTNKVLVTITVLGSAGPLRVILDSNAFPNEMIRQALELYSKEGRRPELGLNCSHFEIRYLQEPSQVLDPNIRIGGLIFRQFLLCQNKNIATASPDDGKKKSKSVHVEGGNSWWSNLMASVTSRRFMQTVG